MGKPLDISHVSNEVGRKDKADDICLMRNITLKTNTLTAIYNSGELQDLPMF